MISHRKRVHERNVMPTHMNNCISWEIMKSWFRWKNVKLNRNFDGSPILKSWAMEYFCGLIWRSCGRLRKKTLLSCQDYKFFKAPTFLWTTQSLGIISSSSLELFPPICVIHSAHHHLCLHKSTAKMRTWINLPSIDVNPCSLISTGSSILFLTIRADLKVTTLRALPSKLTSNTTRDDCSSLTWWTIIVET